MKKNFLFLSLFSIMFLGSCSESDDISAFSKQAEESTDQVIANLEENYEATLKGYVITGPKDENTPSDGIETVASEEYMEYLRTELDKSYTKVATKGYSDDELYVGVLKYTTCGTYREFKYFQDHEDGGWTNKNGDIGATNIDSNKNTNWVFCIVPGASSTTPNTTRTMKYFGGGVLCLNNYQPTANEKIDIVYRYHDDEDNNNKNSIQNSGGLTLINGEQIGKCLFTRHRTRFAWMFNREGVITTLGFKYGIISPDINSATWISIDDENNSNANIHSVTHYENGVGQNWIILGNTYYGMEMDSNTKYYILTRNS